MNIHLANPSFSQLTSMHFYGWKRGLKTGIYYLRTKPSAQAIQFTIDAATQKQAKDNAAAAKVKPAPAVPAVTASLARVSLANTGIPTAAPIAPPKREREEASPGPSEEEEITYEEAKKRAEERAEAALQCSIDNKEACMMCSG